MCHKCDNPLCINPEHLFVGTRKDNVDDCINKGRNVRGEKCNFAKLTEEQAREIKFGYSDLMYKEIAAIFSLQFSKSCLRSSLSFASTIPSEYPNFISRACSSVSFAKLHFSPRTFLPLFIWNSAAACKHDKK
jgi:hypothetical protein